mmetsp:Transcript_78127/g.201182  ORF Transcript_78127/g.201182 Transcript_78127/m.201182 type:complete len:80 (+) Transcript_78127:185-424(+)
MSVPESKLHPVSEEAVQEALKAEERPTRRDEAERSAAERGVEARAWRQDEAKRSAASERIEDRAGQQDEAERLAADEGR